jgi:RHS repeat-associated protein
VHFGLTGHEYDDELGLINMQGRLYDPRIRRFLSPDPVVDSPLSSQSYNRYSYVANNPLSRTDPTGFAAYPNGGSSTNVQVSQDGTPGQTETGNPNAISVTPGASDDFSSSGGAVCEGAPAGKQNVSDDEAQKKQGGPHNAKGEGATSSGSGGRGGQGGHKGHDGHDGTGTTKPNKQMDLEWPSSLSTAVEAGGAFEASVGKKVQNKKMADFGSKAGKAGSRAGAATAALKLVEGVRTGNQDAVNEGLASLTASILASYIAAQSRGKIGPSGEFVLEQAIEKGAKGFFDNIKVVDPSPNFWRPGFTHTVNPREY